MMKEQLTQEHPRIQAALAELQELLARRYPEATFRVSEGDDPEGVYLMPTLDVEDTDEVLDVVMERLLYYQDEEELPVYVMPLLPPTRIAEQLKRRSGRPALPPVIPG